MANAHSVLVPRWVLHTAFGALGVGPVVTASALLYEATVRLSQIQSKLDNLNSQVEKIEKSAANNKHALVAKMKELQRSYAASNQALVSELRSEIRNDNSVVDQWSSVPSARLDTATHFAADKAGSLQKMR